MDMVSTVVSTAMAYYATGSELVGTAVDTYVPAEYVSFYMELEMDEISAILCAAGPIFSCVIYMIIGLFQICGLCKPKGSVKIAPAPPAKGPPAKGGPPSRAPAPVKKAMAASLSPAAAKSAPASVQKAKTSSPAAAKTPGKKPAKGGGLSA